MKKLLLASLFTLLATGSPASAQGLDLTLFAGAAYPTYEERLILPRATLSIPGVEVIPVSVPELRGDGGAVLGAALAFELGIVGIEGRVDAMEAGFDFTGARYDLRGIAAPLQGVTASIVAAPGRFDADRIAILSLNARLRTPGPIGIVASGGLSYLPEINVSGSLPLNIEAPQLPPLGFDADLTLRAAPGQSDDRFGVNGGLGLRIGGRVALHGEVRAFYFRDYELRFGIANGSELLDELLAEADPVRFDPVFVNAQVGLSFRF